MEQLQHIVIGLVDHYGYPGLFLALLLGNVGAPVGTEVVMPVAGALTATGHLSYLWLTIAVSVAAEMVGQSIGYAVGRYGGVPVLERFGKYVGFHHEQLTRIHRFFERYGTFAIFICRCLPVIRGIVGFAAGVAEMSLLPFYVWTFLGSLLFCGVLIVLGNVFGDHLNEILPLLRRGGLVVALVAVVVIVAAVLVVRARAKKNGARVAAAEADANLG